MDWETESTPLQPTPGQYLPLVLLLKIVNIALVLKGVRIIGIDVHGYIYPCGDLQLVQI